MKLKFYKMVRSAIAPQQMTDGAAGFDLSAHIMNGDHAGKVTLYPGEKCTFSTKLRFEIEPGFMMMICSRSGLGAGKGIVVLNQPGIIDSDYRGEVNITLMNTSDRDRFNSCGDMTSVDATVPVITHGMRIAQGIIIPVPKVDLEEVFSPSDLSLTNRGHGGHGSTGV